MYFVLKRDPSLQWCSPLKTAMCEETVLIADDGCEVIPTIILLAASRVLRSMVSDTIFYSPMALTITGVSRDVLLNVRQILTTGEVNVESNAGGDQVEMAMKMLGVESSLNFYQTENLGQGSVNDDKEKTDIEIEVKSNLQEAKLDIYVKLGEYVEREFESTHEGGVMKDERSFDCSDEMVQAEERFAEELEKQEGHQKTKTKKDLIMKAVTPVYQSPTMVMASNFSQSFTPTQTPRSRGYFQNPSMQSPDPTFSTLYQSPERLSSPQTMYQHTQYSAGDTSPTLSPQHRFLSRVSQSPPQRSTTTSPQQRFASSSPQAAGVSTLPEGRSPFPRRGLSSKYPVPASSSGIWSSQPAPPSQSQQVGYHHQPADGRGSFNETNPPPPTLNNITPSIKRDRSIPPLKSMKTEDSKTGFVKSKVLTYGDIKREAIIGSPNKRPFPPTKMPYIETSCGSTQTSNVARCALCGVENKSVYKNIHKCAKPPRKRKILKWRSDWYKKK